MAYVIKTHDGRSLAIKQNDPQVLAALAKRLDLTAVELMSGEIVYLSKGTVARIEKDPTIQQPKIDEDHRIERNAERTDEQLAEGRKKIAKMKEDFINKRIAKDRLK